MTPKRLVRCTECGHTFPSGSTRPKCSKCNGTNCIDVEINEQQHQPQYSQYAQPVEQAPEPEIYYTPHQAPQRNPTAAELKAAMKEAVRECVREEAAASAPTYQAPPQYVQYPQYPQYQMDNAEREELEALREEQDRQIRVEERIRDYCGDDTEVIHNPDYVNSNDREVRVGWIDYDTGKPRAAIAVSEERYNKLLDLEEKEKADECGKSAIKDIAKLNRGGKLAVKEGEAMKLSPEERGGISAGAVAAVLAIGGIAVVGYILFEKYLAKQQVKADEQDPKVNSLQKNILMSNKVLRDRFIQSGGRLEV